MEEAKRKEEIAAATRTYVESQTVFKQMRACANNIVGRECWLSSRFTLVHLMILLGHDVLVDPRPRGAAWGSRVGERAKQVAEIAQLFVRAHACLGLTLVAPLLQGTPPGTWGMIGHRLAREERHAGYFLD